MPLVILSVHVIIMSCWVLQNLQQGSITFNHEDDEILSQVLEIYYQKSDYAPAVQKCIAEYQWNEASKYFKPNVKASLQWPHKDELYPLKGWVSVAVYNFRGS